MLGGKAKWSLHKESWQWYVKDLIDGHNHHLVTRDLASLLRSERRIIDEEKTYSIEMGISRI